jgi:hypothetical protein
METVADSIRKSSINIQNISKSLESTKGNISTVNESVSNISRIISTNTRIKRNLFSRSQVLEFRRDEASKRKEREDIIEASKVSSSPKSGFAFTSKSDKGPLGRLLGFLGFITSGWIVENLPTWIFMGKEFISRIQTFGRAMYYMVGNMQLIIRSFGDVLKNSFNAILRLDFDEFSEGSVAQSFDELNLAVQGLGDDITETFRLFTTPLTEALETGEQAPDLEEDRPETMFPEIPQEGAAPSRVTGIHKQALNIISKYESASSGGYNAMNQGGHGSYGIYGSGDSQSPRLLGKKLTDMTVSEIMQRQVQNNRYSGPNKVGIFAAGRYQIIPNTLKGIVRSGAIKPSDKFDETTQDKAALQLIRESGIQPWAFDTESRARFSSKEKAIIEQARRTPVNYVQSTPSPPKPQSGKGGKIVEYLTGDRTHKRYRSDHAAGNYHDHIAFDSQATRDAAMKFLTGKGWIIGSVNTGRHAEGSYHYSNQAFDIPFYPNQSKKGVTDDAKGETILSSRLRSDLITGGFNGPQLGGSSARPQIFTAPSRVAQSSAMTPERKGSQIMIIDDTKPQVSQASYPSAPQPSYTPTISEFRMLNNFIKNKLLIDLAYL